MRWRTFLAPKSVQRFVRLRSRGVKPVSRAKFVLGRRFDFAEALALV
jgi:hypothetical protein